MYCGVCGNRMKNQCCSLCNFDMSICYEEYPTLQCSGVYSKALSSLRSELYQTMKGITRTQERTISQLRNELDKKIKESREQTDRIESLLASVQEKDRRIQTLIRMQKQSESEKRDSETHEKIKIVKEFAGIKVVGCDKSVAGIIRIPEQIGSERVYKIGKNAFAGCSAITQVMIPRSMVEIGEEAFCGCRQLHSIQLPASANIMDSAFRNCVKLTAVTFLSNSDDDRYQRICQIAENAFWGCSSNLTFYAKAGSMPIEYARAHCFNVIQLS